MDQAQTWQLLMLILLGSCTAYAANEVGRIVNQQQASTTRQTEANLSRCGNRMLNDWKLEVGLINF